MMTFYVVVVDGEYVNPDDTGNYYGEDDISCAEHYVDLAEAEDAAVYFGGTVKCVNE